MGDGAEVQGRGERRDIKLEPADGGEAVQMTWEAAIERYPWLEEYAEDLDGTLAVFANEGIFAKVKE